MNVSLNTRTQTITIYAIIFYLLSNKFACTSQALFFSCYSDFEHIFVSLLKQIIAKQIGYIIWKLKIMIFKFKIDLEKKNCSLSL